MRSYSALYNELTNIVEGPSRDEWFAENLSGELKDVSGLRQNRNVLLYGSAFMQQPNVAKSHLQLTIEDINGFMAVAHGMDSGRGLTLILHTLGGGVSAADTIVSYLRSKFTDIEVIVPTMAMSAGTMLALAGSRIFLAKHSQLGPIDAQLANGPHAVVSAQAIIDQFASARLDLAHDPFASDLWAPILASLGPSRLQEARNAVAFSEELVAKWVANFMFLGDPEAIQKGKSIARFFNDGSTHKSHSRRFGFDEVLAAGVVVQRLEDNTKLMESVLSVYNLMTLNFELSNTTKLLWTDAGETWDKKWDVAIVERPTRNLSVGHPSGIQSSRNGTSASTV